MIVKYFLYSSDGIERIHCLLDCYKYVKNETAQVNVNNRRNGFKLNSVMMLLHLPINEPPVRQSQSLDFEAGCFDIDNKSDEVDHPGFVDEIDLRVPMSDLHLSKSNSHRVAVAPRHEIDHCWYSLVVTH